MPDIFEQLTGGLNNADPPQLLKMGELTSTVNAYYRNISDLLYPAPLLLSLGDVDTNNKDGIVGLAACTFTSGLIRALAVTEYTATKLWRASVTSSQFGSPGVPLTWTDVTPSGFDFDKQLVVVPYNNKFFIFTGAGSNFVFKSDYTFRAHGMTPVSVKPGATVVTSVWPLGEDTFPYFYEYWVTEIIKSGTTVELESSTLATACTTVYIDALTDGVQISRPLNSAGNSFNSAATHWRVYRSVSKEAFNDQAFPNGERISGDIPITSSNFLDGASATLGFTAATVVVSSSSVTNPANLVGAGYATFGGTSNAVLRGFGMGAVTDPVAGIEVKITFNAAIGVIFSGIMQLSISPDGGLTYPCVKTLATTAADTSLTWGSSSDLWDYSAWDAADFSDTTLYVKLETKNIIVTVQVDKVEVKVHYLSGAASSALPFAGIQVTVGGSAVVVGEDSPPPVASCGVMFGDSLVTNDIVNKGRICWSVPGKPEAFPAPYFLDVASTTNDVVTALIVQGNRCLVGTNNSVWRLNYLPTVDDIRFQRGPALDLIDPNNGIVSPLACCTYINAEGRPEVAYMSAKGLRTTDGYTARTLCVKYDWNNWLYREGAALVDDALKYTHLVNNPDNEELILIIPSKGYMDLGDVSTLQQHTHLHFPYAKKHILEDGTLKVTGGMTTVGSDTDSDNTCFASSIVVLKNNNLRSGLSACILMGVNGILDQSAPEPGWGGMGRVYWYAPQHISFSGGTYFDGGYGGNYYQNMVVKTRIIMPSDIHGEWRMKEVYVGPSVNDSATLALYPYNHDATNEPQAASTKTLTAGSSIFMKKVIFDRRAQGMQLKYTTTNTTKSQYFGGLGFFKILAEDFGKEDR